jgi:hypothetical protein
MATHGYAWLRTPTHTHRRTFLAKRCGISPGTTARVRRRQLQQQHAVIRGASRHGFTPGRRAWHPLPSRRRYRIGLRTASGGTRQEATSADWYLTASPGQWPPTNLSSHLQAAYLQSHPSQMKPSISQSPISLMAPLRGFPYPLARPGSLLPSRHLRPPR